MTLGCGTLLPIYLHALKKVMKIFNTSLHKNNTNLHSFLLLYCVELPVRWHCKNRFLLLQNLFHNLIIYLWKFIISMPIGGHFV